MIERKQNKKIAQPWIAEITFEFNDQYFSLSSLLDNKNKIYISLVNDRTGEIRQKYVTVDQIARRVCESEISSSNDIELEVI